MLAAALGKLDVLVNNAAARAFGPVADSTPESWAEVLQTNVTGYAMCARAALPHLRRSGAGSIVNVSSVFAIAGRENMGQYDASKAAMLALTRVLACEEAAHGIRVNAVCPGSTWTPWTYGRAEARGMSLEELKAKGAVPCLLGRWAEADEIAFPILWLASAEASFITGVALPVDGGLSAMYRRFLGFEHRRPEQIFRLIFLRRHALAMRIAQHDIDLVAGLAEPPEIDVFAGGGALLLPQPAIPERGHVDALPFLLA